MEICDHTTLQLLSLPNKLLEFTFLFAMFKLWPIYYENNPASGPTMGVPRIATISAHK